MGFVLLALACAPNHGNLPINRNLNTHSPVVSDPILTSETIPKDLLITMARTVCYGTCPCYNLTIKSDGSVVFEGLDFVKRKGIVKSQISEEQLKTLLAEFDRIKFFTLRDRYLSMDDGCESVRTDHPTTTTTIRVNGRLKKVQHYHGCDVPKILEDLTKFENRIDEIVNTNQWIN
jgi:hypothetical protein